MYTSRVRIHIYINVRKWCDARGKYFLFMKNLSASVVVVVVVVDKGKNIEKLIDVDIIYYTISVRAYRAHRARPFAMYTRMYTPKTRYILSVRPLRYVQNKI